eukprot:TRINITY_DN7951_c0_g1_i1.p1 TRINITY_DN7951_c0_g1~~TRINITY_DN7951_c0_g1_i1.p1  ORF type:complete len:621 (+),score=267.02 TRINITY_DN7951_c0_g1_i1:72-1934(+)
MCRMQTPGGDVGKCRTPNGSTKRFAEGIAVPHHPVLDAVMRELYYMKEFVKYDVTSTLFQFTAVFTVAARQNTSDVPLLGRAALTLWVWIFYTLAFIVPGQIFHIEEDRLNKPNRIMVRGDLTQGEAVKRWAGYIACYMLGSWLCGSLVLSVMWVLCALLHYCTGVLHNTYGYVWKNFLMATGYYILLTTAWRTAGAELHSRALTAILLLCLMVFVTMQTQDFRDVDGDRLTGRRTFPVVLGDVLYTITAAAIFGCAACWAGSMIDDGSTAASVHRAVFVVHSLVVGCGVLANWRIAKVYTLYCLWFVNMLVSLHFTNLEGTSNATFERRVAKADMAGTLILLATVVVQSLPKHAKKKFATGGVPGIVSTVVSWMLLDGHVADMKARSFDILLEEIVENISTLEAEGRSYGSLAEFKEDFWKTAMGSKHYESHAVFVDVGSRFFDGEFSSGTKVFLRNFFAWPRHLANIKNDSTTSRETIVKLVMAKTVTDAYAVCIATGNSDLLDVAKRMRFVRNIPIRADDPNVTIVSRQVREPFVGGEVCPFMKYVCDVQPHNVTLRFGLLVREKERLLEVVEREAGEPLFEDMSGSVMPLVECPFWQDEDYWLQKYPLERDVFRHD